MKSESPGVPELRAEEIECNYMGQGVDSEGRAVFYEGHGRFSVGECTPVKPSRGEVRLRVAYCGVCGTDVHIARGHMEERLSIPQVIGHEMAGTIAELGRDVEGFELGDSVVVRPLDARAETASDRGLSHISRNLRFMGIDSPGAFQASWTVPAFTLHKVPPGLDLRLAALVEPLAVACHDVRRAALTDGELAVVIGGGPIGIMIALVAADAGASVLLSEVNPYREKFAGELGIETIGPRRDLVDYVTDRTGGFGADVVFEVSGSPDGAEVMTQIAGLRGRVVVVAIFAEHPRVRLYDLFLKEISVIGARVYEPEDYEHAINLVASNRLPLEKLISSVAPLEMLPAVLERLQSDPNELKVLVDCQA